MHPKCAAIWTSAVQSLPEEQMKFALNAAVDMLPHNSNLHLWNKKGIPTCPLSQQNQTLLHVLNNCPVSRDLRRYNNCHDAVLRVIASAVQETISVSTSLTVDEGDQYRFPLHIIPTDLRPDLVWWNDEERFLYLAELTVCFETNFKEAAQRKSAKYRDLVEQATHNNYSVTLLTIQMGPRGVLHYLSFQRLSTVTGMSKQTLSHLLNNAMIAALTGSFSIWCSRNRQTT